VKDFTLNGVMTQYKYDLQNHRIAKIYPANNTHDTYVYAEAIDNLNSTQLLGEYNSSGTKQEYVWLGNTPIAVVQNGIILTIHADHLNTPRQLTDATKKVVWNWPYSAFGNNLPSTVGAVKFNLRYPGQYYDAESKLHYNINRYYEPITGRYTQSDLIGLNGGINTYNYVGGNAVGYSDPEGLSPEDVIKIQQVFNNTVNYMSQVKMRRLGTGWVNGALNNFNYFCFGGICESQDYLGCSGQSRYFIGALKQSKFKGLKLDDKWDFQIKTNFGHFWVVGKSSNSNDSDLKLDAWLGESSTNFSFGIDVPNFIIPTDESLVKF
jgi:RHS repeat-associated protein